MILFRNVTAVYENGHAGVRDLNLEIGDGEFVFVTGSSGAGKSTVIKLITRELVPMAGSVVVNGQELSDLRPGALPAYRRTLGVVYQDFRLLSDRSVFENIAFAQRVVGRSAREIKVNVPRMLRLTGLSSKYKNRPSELSGGEQQRTAIARALVNDPLVLLADEPTGNLDRNSSREVMRLLEEINAMGTTVLVVSHDLAMAESMKKRIITIDKGTVIADTGRPTERPKADEVRSEHLQRAQQKVVLTDGLRKESKAVAESEEVFRRHGRSAARRTRSHA